MEGPDAGWAWVVALAACMINFIMAGLGRMSGILFVAFIEIFKVDRKSASMPFSVRSSARNLFGPVVGILGQKYGPRNVIVIGSVIGTVTASACFFAQDILWITVLWGGLNGLASALTVTLPQVVIGQYFVKYRTTASGIAFSGGCVGSFLFPVLLEYLLHNYGIEGTFLVIGAIVMHTIPASLILRKPPWLKKGFQKEEVVIEDSDYKLTQSLDNLVKEAEDNNQMDIETINVQSVNELNSKKFSPVISGKEPNGKDSHRYGDSKNIIVRFEGEENNSFKNTANGEMYPDIKFLRKNKELVVKILCTKLTSKHSSDSPVEVNQNGFSTPSESLISEEIEGLYCLLRGAGEKSQFYKNLRQARNNLICEEANSDMKSNFSQNSRSFNFPRKLPQSELSKARSVPDITNADKSPRELVLSKLSELDTADEELIISKFSHEKGNALRAITELRKLYKMHLKVGDEIVNTAHKGSTLYEDSEINQLSSSLPGPDDGRSNSFWDHIKTAFKLYLNPLFLIVCCCRAVHFITFIPAMTTVVDFTMDKGLVEEDGKYAIAAISLGDLLGRLCLGWITDRGFMSLPKYMMVVMVVQGVSTASLPMMATKWTMFANLALFGMFQGSLFVRHPVLISKYLRSHEQAIAIGCVNFFSGLLGFGLPSYIGYFRDTMGSYDFIFYINGMLGACVGLIWVFEPYFVQCVNAKRTTHKICI